MDRSQAQAARFAELFTAVYLAYHRRDEPRSELSGASWAVLTHLSVTGPLSVGEAAAHLNRAQSAVSEIIDRLERRGLLERETDPTDHRRTLVWLAPAGRDALNTADQVLSPDRLATAFSTMNAEQVAAVLDGLAALVDNSKQDSRTTSPDRTDHDEHQGM